MKTARSARPPVGVEEDVGRARGMSLSGSRSLAEMIDSGALRILNGFPCGK
jgi:hypothetical protein